MYLIKNIMIDAKFSFRFIEVFLFILFTDSRKLNETQKHCFSISDENHPSYSKIIENQHFNMPSINSQYFSFQLIALNLHISPMFNIFHPLSISLKAYFNTLC